MNTYLMPILLMVAVGGYAVFTQSKIKKATSNLGPAFRDFFLKTGFRYPTLAPEPVDLHVQHALAEAAAPHTGPNRIIHYVRNYHGLAVHFRQSYEVTNKGLSISGSWSAPLHAPPRVPFHIAERSLSSVGKVVKEVFSNVTRHWRPVHPVEVQVGIPAIDGRFVVYGHDVEAVRRLFHTNPALVAALVASTEVDLWIDAREAVFADPGQKNMNAAMGGMIGQMAMGVDFGKRLELSIGVHEHVSELLAMSIRAAS